MSFSKHENQGYRMNNTERFSNRVENYVRYRPHYPKEIIPFLEEKIGLHSHWIVADIGARTGISSELFLQNGNTVFAVEPNKKMKEAAEALLKNNPRFISINAKAESTSLQTQSIDLIISGQAFHWFDKIKSKIEFQWIANSEGYLVLMWNDRNLESGFQQAYEKMLIEFAIDYEEINYRNVDEECIKAFFLPNECSFQCFHHSQFFDFEGLKGRLLSSSYAPLEHHPNHNPMLSRLKEIFEAFNVDSKVEFEYNCCLYFGKMN